MNPLLPTVALLALALSGCVEAPAAEAATDVADAPLEGADAPPAPGTPFSAEGSSRADFTGVCIAVCAYAYSSEFGAFSAETAVEGAVLEATWSADTPLTDEIEVYVMSGETEVAAATGASPLKLDLGELPPGKYEVRIGFPVAAGHLSEDVDWTVAGTVAGAAA